MWYLKRLLLIAAVLIAALFVFVFFASTSERPIPSATAGFSETSIEVSHRSTPLPVFIWYPTLDAGTPELIGQNALFYGFHAQRDATGDPQAAPVVVLSHGSGGNAVSLGWVASELAQRGMIVLATNHPGTTSRDSTPEATVRIWERPQDLSALLDYAQNGLPHGIVADMDNVATMGFSLGGYSALAMAGLTVSKAQFLEYCETWPTKIDCGWMNANGLDFDAIEQVRYEQSNRDDRVTAVLAIDPALPRAVTDAGIEALNIPALVVQLGDTDTLFEGMLWGDVAGRIDTMEHVTVTDTFHFGFMAECSLMGKVIIATAGDDNICSNMGTRDRAKVHAELIPLIGDYLARQLNVER